MSRPKKTEPPAYREHKARGLAVVTINGHDKYLGAYNSPESRAAYDRLIGLWLANGRKLPEPEAADAPSTTLTIVELVDQYREWSVKEYGDLRNGEHGNTMEAVAPVVRLFGRLPASAFGPNALRMVRQSMVDGTHRLADPDKPKPLPLARKTINDRTHRIRRVFRWAVSRELIPSSVIEALNTVDCIRSGRGQARETAPVKPVDEATVNLTVPHLPGPVGDMAKLQLATGMRSGELCRMRGCDIDMTDPACWLYRPARHKNTHRGQDRVVWLGPQAQAIIEPYLTGKPQEYLFSPRRARDARYASMREARVTPLQPSQVNRKNRKAQRLPGARYRVGSYAYAITRACRKHGIEPWHPHQIRHAVATRLRREYGIEAARLILGHNSLAATAIYAEADLKKASAIMTKVG